MCSSNSQWLSNLIISKLMPSFLSSAPENSGFVYMHKRAWLSATLQTEPRSDWGERRGSVEKKLWRCVSFFFLPLSPSRSLQDEKYWQRRKKNNVAAKRSRDARRLKENQITVRAAFLERENAALRTEVAELRKECGRFKNVVGQYEAKFGPM